MQGILKIDSIPSRKKNSCNYYEIDATGIYYIMQRYELRFRIETMVRVHSIRSDESYNNYSNVTSENVKQAF